MRFGFGWNSGVFDTIECNNICIQVPLDGVHDENTKFRKIPRFYIEKKYPYRIYAVAIIGDKVIPLTFNHEIDYEVSVIKKHVKEFKDLWFTWYGHIDNMYKLFIGDEFNPSKIDENTSYNYIYKKHHNLNYNICINNYNLCIEYKPGSFAKVKLTNDGAYVKNRIFFREYDFSKEIEFINSNLDIFYPLYKTYYIYKSTQVFNPAENITKPYKFDCLDDCIVTNKTNYNILVPDDNTIEIMSDSDFLKAEYIRVKIIGNKVLLFTKDKEKYKEVVDFIRRNIQLFKDAKKFRMTSYIPTIINELRSGKSYLDAWKDTISWYYDNSVKYKKIMEYFESSKFEYQD